MIVLGAAAYNTFLALSQLPQELAGLGGQLRASARTSCCGRSWSST